MKHPPINLSNKLMKADGSFKKTIDMKIFFLSFKTVVSAIRLDRIEVYVQNFEIGKKSLYMEKQRNKSPGSRVWAKACNAISSRTKYVTFFGGISGVKESLLCLLFFLIPHIKRMMAPLATLI